MPTTQKCSDLPSDFVLGASRLVPYKRLDLGIQLGGALDLPIVIAGAGPTSLDYVP